MPINAGPEYFKVEKEYLNAKNVPDKIFWLEELIKVAPKHKGSENLLAELRTRLKKLKEKSEKLSKKSGGNKKGIKKEGFQFVIIGKTGVGKSSLLSKLTNATPLIADYPFTTKFPEIGTFVFNGVKAQLIENPGFGSENFDIGLANGADCLIIFINEVNDIDEYTEKLFRATNKRIFVFNKSDLLNENEKRKLRERIKSKRINGVLISCNTLDGFEELTEKMFLEMDIVRVYTKEPGKNPSPDPVVLKIGSNVRDVAEKILKGFSLKIKETRLTGPSGKFSNQKVGLKHILKDRDIIEFHT